MTHNYPDKIPNSAIDDPSTGPTINFLKRLTDDNNSRTLEVYKGLHGENASDYQGGYLTVHEYAITYKMYSVVVRYKDGYYVKGHIFDDNRQQFTTENGYLEKADDGYWFTLQPTDSHYCVTEDNVIDWVRTVTEAIDDVDNVKPSKKFAGKR